MKYYDDVVVGETIVFDDSYLVTEEEILEFGNRFDPQPFHTDKAAAEKTMFGGLVASSCHIFAIVTAIGQYDEKNKIAALTALGFNNLQWHQPVRPGDTLYSRYKIESKRESKSRPGTGIMENHGEVFNQNGDVVFTLEVNFIVPKKDYQAA